MDVLGGSLGGPWGVFEGSGGDLVDVNISKSLHGCLGMSQAHPGGTLEALGDVLEGQGRGFGGRVHETGRAWEGPRTLTKMQKRVFLVPWIPNVHISKVF